MQYFFIKDMVDKEEITIIYCPTEYMVADFFSYPLQGKLFVKFRDIIMGTSLTDTWINECVEYTW